MNITLQPSILEWARKRVKLTPDELAEKMGVKPERVAEWEKSGELTLAQAEKLARVTHVSFGYLFLDKPPTERLPIYDFRTVGSQPIEEPSPELLQVVNSALLRQDWYREYLTSTGEGPLSFVGSLKVDADPVVSADNIRKVVHWDARLRANAATWEEALAAQIERVEDAGILVMRSSIVGNNTHRPLSENEFRGFALADNLAPLIFINSRDAKAAQMFTLAHEVAHIWVGASGVSNLRATYAPDGPVETFCNAVAAELLVPATELAGRLVDARLQPDPLQWLTRYFKVSSLVVLRRLRDIAAIGEEDFRERYAAQLERAYQRREGGGGDYYRTIRSRLGRRFVSAIIESALEGRTLYRDACRMLEISNVDRLRRLAREVGLGA